MRILFRPILWVALTAFAILPDALAKGASAKGTIGIKSAPERRAAVVRAFRRNWDAYMNIAYPRDKISPIAKQGVDDETLAGFSGTVVDSLSTHIVLGMSDSPNFKTLLEKVKTIDFTKTTQGIDKITGQVSIFELTIRYIGGLLSAYQLNGEKKEEFFLVEQAQSLADQLSVGWLKGQQIPFNNVNINEKRPQSVEVDVNLAQAGTLSMEWAMLSKFSGNKKYANLAIGSVDAILSSKPYFPNVWATRIYPQNNSISSTYITTGGGCDSFIEYLLKLPVLLGNSGHRFLKTYSGMMDTFKKELVSKTGGGLTFIADYNIDKKEVNYVGSHLACFIGGNIAYAGRLMERDDLLQLGLEVTESCYATYNATTTGIGPYAWGWFDANNEAKGWGWVNGIRRTFFNQNGFFVNVGYWVQHPEVFESLFYAWRITRDERWRDMAWQGFLQVQEYTYTETAWAGVVNVNDDSTGLLDQTESYLFAEVFKYLGLIFSDSNHYSLDEWVFTTEGHLFKRDSGAGTDSKDSGNEQKKWGKVQDYNFNYKPLERKTSTAPVTEGVRPLHILTAKAGSSKAEVVNAFKSQLSMDSKVAEDLLSRLPTKQVQQQPQQQQLLGSNVR